MYSGVDWLPHVSSVVADLATGVASHFGPCGRDQISHSSIGQIIISNSGSSDRDDDTHQQPVARLVQTAVRSHGDVCGDGSSSVIIMLSAALRSCLTYTHKQCGLPIAAGLERDGIRQPSMKRVHASIRARRRILTALQSIHRHWFGHSALARWMVKHKSLKFDSQMNEEVKAAMTHLVRTMMAHKLTPQAVSMLTERLVEMVWNARRGGSLSLHATCRALLDDCPFMHCTQLPLTQTLAMHGFLIPARMALRSMPTSLTNTRMLILHCTIQHGSMLSDEAQQGRLEMEVQNSAHAVQLLMQGEQHAKIWIQRFKQDGIGLVLSTHKLHESTLALLSSAGVSAIHCMDEFDTRRIAKYAHMTPVHSLDEYDDGCEASNLPIGEVIACNQVLVGSQWMIHLELERLDVTQPSSSTTNSSTVTPDQLIRPYTLLLCGASEGMCQQYEQMLRRALKMVAQWDEECRHINVEVGMAANDHSTAATRKSQSNQPKTAAASTTKGGMFGGMRGGFFDRPPKRTTTNSSPSSSSASPSPSPLYVLGGGGSVELSLLHFCEEQVQARQSSRVASEPSSHHPLLPPEASSSNDAAQSDFVAAFSILTAAFSSIIQTLLINALPSTSTTSMQDIHERAMLLSWHRIMPHLRTLHQHLSMRNLGIALTDANHPLPYSPLHQSMRHYSSSADDLVEKQIAVARSELALHSLLSPLFIIRDTAAAPLELYESLPCKLHTLSAFMQLLMNLLRIEGMMSVNHTNSARNQSSIAAFNRGNSTKDRRRRLIRHVSQTVSGWDEEFDTDTVDDRLCEDESDVEIDAAVE